MIMGEDYIKESKEIWDKIAESFDSTRRKPWQKCIDFIDSLPRDAVVIDIGCGNGRHLIPCAKRCRYAIGLDLSINLLKIVQKRIEEENIENVLLIKGDAANIPIKDKSVDAALYIATLHAIKGRKNRIKSLSEIRRILKEDGIAMISVWTKWRNEYKKKEAEVGDKVVDWKKDGLNVKRFYHIYSKRELKKDIKDAGLEIIKFEEVKLHTQKHPDNYFVLVK